jgi:hypothetical protein
MNAIAFQSMIKDNMIQVPEQYRLDANSPVLVTITLMPASSAGHVGRGSPPDDRPLIIPRRKRGRVTEDNFTALKIDTKNFRFNREEANER